MTIEKINKISTENSESRGINANAYNYIVDKLNEIIDALQPEGEKWGGMKPNAEEEFDNLEERCCENGNFNTIHNCMKRSPQPVMTDRDKMAQPAPRDRERDKMFADVSERSPQPVSMVEGWREELRDLYLSISPNNTGHTRSIEFNWGKFTFDQKIEKVEFYLTPKDSMEDFISGVIAQVREEERARAQEIVKNKFSTIGSNNVVDGLLQELK